MLTVECDARSCQLANITFSSPHTIHFAINCRAAMPLQMQFLRPWWDRSLNLIDFAYNNKRHGSVCPEKYIGGVGEEFCEHSNDSEITEHKLI